MRLEDIFNFAHPNMSKKDHMREVVSRWIMDPNNMQNTAVLESLIKLGDPIANQIGAWAAINDLEYNNETVASIVEDYKLPREAVPTKYLKSPHVWTALLKFMPIHALIRNLNVMIDNGAYQMNKEQVEDRIYKIDPKDRVSAMDLFKAYIAIGEEHRDLRAVLSKKFYKLLETEEKVKAKVLIAVDVSGSMGAKLNENSRNSATCLDVATGMAIAASKAFEFTAVVGFDTSIHIPVLGATNAKEMWPKWGGGTNAGLIIDYMNTIQHNFDAVLFLTDNDAWLGNHVQEMIKKYRIERKHPAVLAINSINSNTITLADPEDFLSLDISGFNAEVIRLLQTKLALIRG
jgi:hypothetical protein